MNRRAFLASTGAIALAGCTASGDDGREYVVHGLEKSDIYPDASVREAGSLKQVTNLGSRGDLRLYLGFDSDEFDVLDHDIYLMDGDTVVSEGNGAGSFSGGMTEIQFGVRASDLEQEPTYRVVTMNVVEHVDDFELLIDAER